MRLFSTLTLTLLVCVSLSLTLTARANPPDATHHGIEETHIGSFRVVEVGVGDTLYASDGVSKVRRSTDHGANWSNWRTFTSMPQSVWIDSGGLVYLTFADNDTLKRCTADGTCADVLTFHVLAYSWHMAENDSLYCATYCSTEATGDTTGAYLYTSSTGEHWRLINHPHSRHYHFVAAHPWNDTLYTSRGDGTGNQFLEKSGDNGANWTTILSSDCLAQPTSFAFTPTRCIFGSDCGGGSGVNKFYFQDNTDGSWTVADSLSGTQENFVWSMATDPDRVIFAGTVGKSVTDNDVRMYASYDSGTSWVSVRDFHDEVQWDGVSWISQGTDASGYKYYTVNDDDGLGFDTYRFKNKPVWTVGTGGDFADVATALADWRVDDADTLIMLAGTHTIQDDAATAGLTVRGATRDASLYLMKNGAANASGFTVAVAGVTFKDLTFRTLTEITTDGKSMIEVADGGQVTVTRCAFRNCDGNSAPGILIIGAGAGTTTATLTDCIADSCSADTHYGGFLNATDADAIVIDGLVATNNWCVWRGGVVYINDNADDVTIKNSLFVDNRSGDDGAAVYLDGAALPITLKVWHCTFDGNESADIDEGQLQIRQPQCNLVISHCIFANSDSTYALSVAGYPDSVRHCDSWNTGNDNFGWNAPACTDTIHVAPDYNCLNATTDCYRANAPELETCADGSFMGWLRGMQRRGRPVALGIGRRRGRR